jgi:hypothetical protein
VGKAGHAKGCVSSSVRGYERTSGQGESLLGSLLMSVSYDGMAKVDVHMQSC